MHTQIEEYIYELYTSIGVKKPSDLDMKYIAWQLGAKIVYKQSALRFGDEVILTRSTDKKEWIEFGHEICHYLRHSGSQIIMPSTFRDLQEWQADNFAYHFCVPTFMLDEYDFPYYHGQAIQRISDDFNVTIEFAQTRFYMYLNKQKQRKFHKQFQHSLVTEKQSTYSTEELIDLEFNLDNEILPEECYEFFDLTVHKEAKIKGTIEFIKIMRKKGLL